MILELKRYVWEGGGKGWGEVQLLAMKIIMKRAKDINLGIKHSVTNSNYSIRVS